MSAPRKLSAAEYLKERGWAPYNDDGDRWCAARVDGWHFTDAALLIRRARDAEEERRAWVAFAASPSAAKEPNAAIVADAMLDDYRARFAVEVAS